MKVRWFNYGVGERADGTLEAHPDEVWYRLSLKTDEPWKKISLTRRAAAVGIISDAKFDLHTAPLSLPAKKVKDLAKFRAWLPREFHPLYPNPPVGDEEDEGGERMRSARTTGRMENEQEQENKEIENEIEQMAEKDVEREEEEEERDEEDDEQDEDGIITEVVV